MNTEQSNCFPMITSVGKNNNNPSLLYELYDKLFLNNKQQLELYLKKAVVAYELETVKHILQNLELPPLDKQLLVII